MSGGAAGSFGSSFGGSGRSIVGLDGLASSSGATGAAASNLQIPRRVSSMSLSLQRLEVPLRHPCEVRPLPDRGTGRVQLAHELARRNGLPLGSSGVLMKEAFVGRFDFDGCHGWFST